MKNHRLLLPKIYCFVTVLFFSFLYTSSLEAENRLYDCSEYSSISLDEDDSCWPKVWFKNHGCISAVIYRIHHGKYIFYTKIKQHEEWAITSEKGTEWAISDGQSVRKKWTVFSCYNQEVDLDFGGCHDNHYTCQSKVTFNNKHCKSLSIYWNNSGHHVHYKDLPPSSNWSVSSKKGHEWLIKEGHNVKKRWQVSSCYDNIVDLSFGGCTNYYTDCHTKVTFKNDHCKKLSIYWDNKGSHVHFKDIDPYKSWSSSTKKGHNWIVKQGHTVMKKWQVTSCDHHNVSLRFSGCNDQYGACDTKVKFQNDHCKTLSIYWNNNGQHVHYKDLAANNNWTTSTKKGHEWIIKEGHSIKKKWQVGSCYDETVKLYFGNCHTTYSSCTAKVGFKNESCRTLSIYWDRDGEHVHYKDLGHNGYWNVTTRQGHKWIIKQGHTVIKNWTVPSCSDQTVKLDFGWCSSGYSACSVKVGFINKNCGLLKLYWNNNGQHVHYKDLGHNGYWKVSTKKGHEWIIKKGNTVMKQWTVTHCTDHNVSLNYGGCEENLCSDGSAMKTPGTACDDHDDKTENDKIQDDGCTCKGTKVTSGYDDECEMSNDGYESSWGSWYDGGSDCKRHYSKDHMYGNYSVALRNNNGWSSSTYSSALNMYGHSSVQVSFAYRTEYLSANESFALEYSPNDGQTWYKVKRWYKGTHFSNDKMYHDEVSFKSSFGSRTRFRFRCYASSSSNHVYLDNVKIASCTKSNLTSDVGKESFGKSKQIGLEIVQDLSVYPNPVTNVLRLEGLGEGERFTVFSIDGKSVLTQQSQNSVNVSGLQSGAYIIKTEFGQVTKFIKK